MAHSIELPPDLESDLIAQATRVGLPLEFYALEVLRRNVISQEPKNKLDSDNQGARFLELTEQLLPVIQAGISPEGIMHEPSEIIDSIRAEREDELIKQV